MSESRTLQTHAMLRWSSNPKGSKSASANTRPSPPVQRFSASKVKDRSLSSTCSTCFCRVTPWWAVVGLAIGITGLVFGMWSINEMASLLNDVGVFNDINLLAIFWPVIGIAILAFTLQTERIVTFTSAHHTGNALLQGLFVRCCGVCCKVFFQIYSWFVVIFSWITTTGWVGVLMIGSVVAAAVAIAAAACNVQVNGQPLTILIAQAVDQAAEDNPDSDLARIINNATDVAVLICASSSDFAFASLLLLLSGAFVGLALFILLIRYTAVWGAYAAHQARDAEVQEAYLASPPSAPQEVVNCETGLPIDLECQNHSGPCSIEPPSERGRAIFPNQNGP